MNDGGPAFPTDCEPSVHGTIRQIKYSGISIRDYFAAAALQGIISNDIALRAAVSAGLMVHQNQQQSAAQLAYGFADALLAERERAK